jgi:hypothetical protein
MHPDVAQYIEAYLISVVAGHFIVAPILWVMRRSVGLDEKMFELSLFWLGGTERVIATTLVIWAPSYVAPFIGAWVALKIAASWQRMPSTSENRQGTHIALIGSALSFAVAIGAGLLVHPAALDVWAK